MGICNTTPDSFSDGGHFLTPSDARDRVRAMADEGADWIDVGGESTRPGSEPVDAGEQWKRVRPAIEAAAGFELVCSIDTTSAEVARRALDSGATVVNDVSAGRFDREMPAVMATAKAVVLMHMLGSPRTMQQSPAYDDVVAEVRAHLHARAATVESLGLDRHRILLDPGIGFGKTLEHNLALLRNLDAFTGDYPLLIGTSRKRFIGELTGVSNASDRVFGTAATVALAVAAGASVVRVHDVKAMRQVVDVTVAITR